MCHLQDELLHWLHVNVARDSTVTWYVVGDSPIACGRLSDSPVAFKVAMGPKVT